MKKFGLLFIALILTTIAVSQTVCPELVSSSGDSFDNTTYQLDWSIGECQTETHSAESYLITQGFHQNSYFVTVVEEFPEVGLNITVYPNPTTALIELNVESFKDQSSETRRIQYIVTDFNGKVLQNEKIKNNIEQLNFSTYTNGIYFLTVKQENQVIKSFKIIKN